MPIEPRHARVSLCALMPGIGFALEGGSRAMFYGNEIQVFFQRSGLRDALQRSVTGDRMGGNSSLVYRGCQEEMRLTASWAASFTSGG